MKPPTTFHVEHHQSLPIRTTTTLVTEDERAAYLQRVAEARIRLRDFQAERGFEVCDTLAIVGP